MEKGNQAVSKTRVNGPLDGLLDFNLSQKDGAAGTPFGSSTPLTFSSSSLVKETKELKAGKKEIEEYREVQSLQLTRVQEKILAAVTEEKLESASLTELARAYDIFKKNELLAGGKATQITGIVGYLLQLEKEETESSFKVIEVNSASSEEDLESGYSVDEDEPLPCL